MSATAVGDRARPPAIVQADATPTWWSWTGALGLLVLVVWLVPIKSYRLPAHLPFNLELYRLLLIVFLLVWAASVLLGDKPVTAAGLGKPVLVLACVGVLSVLANLRTIVNDGLQTQAVKSLSYFLSFLVVYVLVTSTVDSLAAVDLLVRVLVVGGAIVAVAALYESRRRYNVFQHLNTWVPFLDRTQDVANARIRGGRLRVVASAQHPIALGAALVMAVPLALYLVSRARTRARSLVWWAAALIVLTGAVATISRTVVLMAIGMVAVALLARRSVLFRYSPVLLALAVAIHFGSPGAVTHLYRAFFPHQGLSQSQEVRSGGVGSGRLADVAPGFRAWEQVPFFGHGLGTGVSAGTVGTGAIVDPNTGAPIIFDNQYLNSLVSIGAIGIIGVLWFVWGGALTLLGAARRRLDAAGDLMTACAASTVAFALGMFTFDAFSFVQATLVFFVIAALGLRARALAG
jgi:hypothetical protein